jgi:hypothetical protein
VKVHGVKKGATYSHQPKIRCTAVDALSGGASRTVQTHKLGHTLSYVATAKDRAGNVRKRAGSVRVS